MREFDFHDESNYNMHYESCFNLLLLTILKKNVCEEIKQLLLLLLLLSNYLEKIYKL